MPGPKPRPTLETELAARFRFAVKRRIEAKGVARADVIGSMAHLPTRSQRWLEGALGPSEPLPVDNALEISARLHRLNVRLPDVLLEELLAEYRTPAILVFPGETQRLVALLLDELRQVNGCGPRSLARLERSFTALFESYERFNETPTGRELVHRVKTEMRLGGTKNWKLNYMRFTQHLAVDATTATVPSLPRLVDAAVRARLSKRRREKPQ